MPSLLSRLILISIAFITPNVIVAQQSSQPTSGIVRFPTIHNNDIAFVYAGDVWSVPRSGGEATRLTNSAGPKNNTRFSPDGKTIAFTGTLNGIYTIPARGGEASRITHNPGTTTLCSWTPIMVAPLRPDLELPWSPDPRKPDDTGRIELEKFEYRALAAVPVREPGRYSNLAVASDGGMIGGGAINIPFVDGGWSLIPFVGFYDESGKWVVEGHGVEPDITVVDDPGRMVGGANPQLDAAIELMLKEIKDPLVIPRVP